VNSVNKFCVILLIFFSLHFFFTSHKFTYEYWIKQVNFTSIRVKLSEKSHNIAKCTVKLKILEIEKYFYQ
jgi:hypothetical protein